MEKITPKIVASEFVLYLMNRIISRLPLHSLRLWFYRSIAKFEIGRNSYIFMDAWFDCKGGFRMGEHSVINQKCRLDSRGGIVIGNNVAISAEVCILTADHDPGAGDFSDRHSPVAIHDYAFIGTRAMILRGVTIGRGAVVGAGSIVTKDVAPYTVVAGCPAREIGKREADLDYQINYGRLFC